MSRTNSGFLLIFTVCLCSQLISLFVVYGGIRLDIIISLETYDSQHIVLLFIRLLCSDWWTLMRH